MGWIEKVNDIVQGLSGELNSNDTRVRVVEEVKKILDADNIESRIDCSSTVNTPEVVSHGGFLLLVVTKEIDFLFKYVGSEVNK